MAHLNLRLLAALLLAFALIWASGASAHNGSYLPHRLHSSHSHAYGHHRG
jgi:hypothetical protein